MLSVKEQREDGSWYGVNIPYLRCTLTVLEINYQIKIPSKQINKVRSYSSTTTQLQIKLNLASGVIKLNPWFLTGFTDANNIKKIDIGNKFIRIPSRSNKTNSLVIWGQNLTSSVGLGRFTKQVSNMIRLPPYQQSVIIGLILYDGWLIFASSTHKQARLGFAQSLSRSAYVWFVFNLLSHYCSSCPKLVTGRREGTCTYALQIFTRSLPCFTELYSIFNSNKVKRIPDNIYELLTPIALAHLIMGDGSALSRGLKICTDSYSIKDVVRLMNVLIIKYRLECTLRTHRKNQYRIYIRQSSMPLLQNIVRSHMHSSMLYKLG